MAATQTPPTALVPSKPIQQLRLLLERSKDQLAMALPQHMTADRMTRIAITAVQKQPKLLECTALSIVGCVIEASQLGLYPDGILGDAYLVPFWNGKTRQLEAQLQPGYRGLINLARRSGQVSAIYSEPVYACDKFAVELGTEHTIIHVPNYDDAQRGIEKDELGVPVGLRGVYAVVNSKTEPQTLNTCRCIASWTSETTPSQKTRTERYSDHGLLTSRKWHVRHRSAGLRSVYRYPQNSRRRPCWMNMWMQARRRTSPAS